MAFPEIGERRPVETYITTDEIREQLDIGSNVSLLLHVPTAVSIIFDIFKVGVVNFLPFTVFGLTLSLYSEFLKAMLNAHPDAKGFNITEVYEWYLDPISGYEDVARWKAVAGTRRYSAVY